ncbi:MAG TPA: TIM-barrel domain-containing protein [Chitinophagaceae bacterium]|jgi:alpha-D-xyloside xylohydrolase
MLKKRLPGFTGFTIIIFLLTALTSAVPPGDYSKLEDGVVIRLKKRTENGARLVKLQAITDKIIHVTASPLDSFITTPSLMAVEKKRPPVKWDIKETSESVTLVTSYINAKVSLLTGEISFTDKDGHPLTRETKETSKTFLPITVDGRPSWQIAQVFESPDDEAFYGLGQHQSGVMNYKGHGVELLQNNSEVAVPFLVSNKNYGILWDNYSITRIGDSRPFEPLSALRLTSAEGSEGWLTATYSNKNNPSEVWHRRPESTIDYDNLTSLIKLPQDIKLSNAKVSWDGFIESGYTGRHQFLFRYGGYAKIWINGQLLADRWRQSWNPGTALLPVDLVKGKKVPVKIEWLPDGDESYLSLKWLSPAPASVKNDWTFLSESGNAINYYLMYGATMDEVISGYREITGAAPVMPKWAMGLWQSRERYKTQDEILNTVAEFRKRRIPLDNIVLDWSYWEESKWGSQEFDTSRFPDAAGMIKTLHEKYNTHFMISVWPKFYEGIANYNYFDKEGWLYKRNITNRQRDWIGKGYVSTFYDAFNPRAREAFWGLLNQHLYSKGVDAWWLDATEPDMHSNASLEERKQLMSPTWQGSSTTYFNAFPLLNASAVYDGQRRVNPGKRVFILTRSAYAGLQRYSAGVWSGDIAARWHDMKNQIAAGVNFSMSGIPYWTMDIGGFAVEKKYEKAQEKDLEEWREQMARWYQFGAFCPLFRVHGQFPYREIYNTAPEDHPAYKSMLYYDKLRYRLMPYIYSLSGKTWQEGYTIMRGLVMDFGADTAVQRIDDQYMFGPSLLVNPVYEPGAQSRQVYLPGTTGWYDFYTGKYYEGGQQLKAAAPYERLPLFVKEGSIIPFGPAIQYTEEKPADTIALYVYTGKDAHFTLYEDENDNYNYENGAYATISFDYNEQTKELTIGNREGSFSGMLQKRTFIINWINKNEAQSLNLDQPAGTVLPYTGEKTSIKMK